MALLHADIELLLARSMALVFESYGCKLYASIPGGEIAYGDTSGLYEWRGHERIHYSGGDQQASDRDGFYHHSDLLDQPFLRGLALVWSRVRLN